MPLHIKGIRHLMKGIFNRLNRRRVGLQSKHRAHKKLACRFIIKLLESANIAVPLSEKTRYSSHHAATSAAGTGKNIGLCTVSGAVHENSLTGNHRK